MCPELYRVVTFQKANVNDLARHIVGLVVACVLATLWFGCASRYRLELTITDEGVPHRVKVEQTQFASGAILGDATSDRQVEPGNANCLVVSAGIQVKSRLPIGKYDILQYDEHLQYRIFLHLPKPLEPGR